MIPHRENHLVLDTANSESKQNCRAIVKLLRLTVEQFLIAVYN